MKNEILAPYNPPANTIGLPPLPPDDEYDRRRARIRAMFGSFAATIVFIIFHIMAMYGGVALSSHGDLIARSIVFLCEKFYMPIILVRELLGEREGFCALDLALIPLHSCAYGVVTWLSIQWYRDYLP